VCYSVLECFAVCCSGKGDQENAQHHVSERDDKACVLQCVAVCCSELQCVIAC